MVQYNLREYAAAKQRHEEALAIRRNSLPPDHPDIATSLNNLGLVQNDLRDYAGAKQRHEEALAIRRNPCLRTTPTSPPVSTTWGWCKMICGTTRVRSRPRGGAGDPP